MLDMILRKPHSLRLYSKKGEKPAWFLPPSILSVIMACDEV
ncbi:MAG: hypothetical protein QF586_07585 [Arenicellales bacterium]|nr:hypothetical protein [Arenicellales bacterium]